MNITAIILCGGNATRMGSLCELTPKALMEFNGKPFLEWLVQWLHSQKIKEVIFATGNLHGQIEDRFKNAIFSREYQQLGTAGALRKAVEKASNDHVLVLNGDTLFYSKISDAYRYHISKGGYSTQLLSIQSNQDKGKVKVDNVSGLVVSQDNEIIQRKNICNLSSTGAYIFSKNAIKSEIQEGKKISLENDIVPKLIKNQSLYFYVNNQKPVYDYGTPARLSAVQRSYDRK